MPRAYYVVMSIAVSCLFSFSPASAEVDVAASFDKEGLKGFHVSLGEYFNVPEPEICKIEARGIGPEDMPVVLFLAAKAGASPAAIVDFRLDGKSWMNILHHFKLNPEIFYVPVKVKVHGPPYGKAYGYYKNKPRKEWGTISLADVDIVNLVNLRFLTEHYGKEAAEIIDMRARGEHFIAIYSKAKKTKKATKETPKNKQKKAKENKGGKSKSKKK
ncbi:hypothetical protein ACFLU6_12860 [Acidobacteriota bacterium]